jgi:hypothetical protein
MFLRLGFGWVAHLPCVDLTTLTGGVLVPSVIGHLREAEGQRRFLITPELSLYITSLKFQIGYALVLQNYSWPRFERGEFVSDCSYPSYQLSSGPWPQSHLLRERCSSSSIKDRWQRNV